MGKSISATNENVRSYMPNDLALCLLSKLPVKSLKRFGCVHKSWASFSENSHFMSVYQKNFISNHYSCFDDTSLLLLQTSVSDFFSLSGERYENIVRVDWPNPFEYENPWFWILNSGSVNGILCLYNANKQKTVVLWNPATDELKVIPPSPLESVPPYQQFLVLLQGFGYDHIRDDYKLIRTISYMLPSTWDCEHLDMSLEDVPWEDISTDTLCEMYSIRSNSWRKLDIDDPVVCLGYPSSDSQLYLDGILHWLKLKYEHSSCYYEENTLVSFDLVNEVFYTTPIPLDISLLDEYNAFGYLVVFNGSLALISWIYRTTVFDILILGELGVKESWTKLFTVGPLSCVESPIGIGKKGDIFFRKNDGEIILFDLGSQKIEELGVKGMDYSHILICKENLLPI